MEPLFTISALTTGDLLSPTVESTSNFGKLYSFNCLCYVIKPSPPVSEYNPHHSVKPVFGQEGQHLYSINKLASLSKKEIFFKFT